MLDNLLDFEKMSTLTKVQFGLESLKLIKIVMLKIVYSAIIIRIAKLTKACLDESIKMNENMNARRQNLYRRLFHFTLIPIVLNFIFFGHEILSVDFMVLTKKANYIAFQIQPITTLTVFTLGSLIYFIGFFSLFSCFGKTQ